MALTYDAEIFVLLYMSLGFTLFHFVFGTERNPRIVLGTLTALSWIVFGVVYVRSTPTFPEIALFLFAVGIVFVITTIHDSLEQTKEYKEET